jgi:hypothetical protein
MAPLPPLGIEEPISAIRNPLPNFVGAVPPVIAHPLAHLLDSLGAGRDRPRGAQELPLLAYRGITPLLLAPELLHPILVLFAPTGELAGARRFQPLLSLRVGRCILLPAGASFRLWRFSVASLFTPVLSDRLLFLLAAIAIRVIAFAALVSGSDGPGPAAVARAFRARASLSLRFRGDRFLPRIRFRIVFRLLGYPGFLRSAAASASIVFLLRNRLGALTLLCRRVELPLLLRPGRRYFGLV